jgi:eukaryotic-like serine/threonine-protein kinase
VLYEMLTGIAAFPATTIAARVKAASTPVTRPDGLTDATWAVLARALASEPSDRYADGAAMADALHRLPGVPAPAVVPPDPSAPTELIALPTAAAEVAAEPAANVASNPAAVSDAATSRSLVTPLPEAETAGSMASAPPWIDTSVATSRERTTAAATVSQRPSRSALAMAGIVGALTLALVAGMAASATRGDGTDNAATAPSAPPNPALSAAPSPEPTATPVPSKPPKGEGKGKGDGKPKPGH